MHKTTQEKITAMLLPANLIRHYIEPLYGYFRDEIGDATIAIDEATNLEIKATI